MLTDLIVFKWGEQNNPEHTHKTCSFRDTMRSDFNKLLPLLKNHSMNNNTSVFLMAFFFDSCFGCATFLKFMHFIIFVYIYLNSSRYMKNSIAWHFWRSFFFFLRVASTTECKVFIILLWLFINGIFSCAINSIRLNAHAIDLMNSTMVCILFTHLPHSHSLIPFLRWLFVQIQRATDPSGIT